ncbi:acyl-CoA synthetase [Roseomonas sp. CECT 9278]|uniref:acyl-CoA synthetase n=1 Tax=Roseomonas sp. CECT 9278 TaxID=2845823 RepID=UPI001E4BF997|nr:acyl-CoA synthetase [Roseomonas sp. CECT 9278]CAH0201652.1 Long-chain-fatty-acid--CoA ligase [Roseomonas sp. CECT 9278]
MIISGDRSITQDALMARVRRAATGFAALGVGPGDCVALLLRNDFTFLEASLAASTLGGYAVPINWHWKPDEIGYLLRDCEARIVVVHQDLAHLLSDAPDGLVILVVPTPPECVAAYGMPVAGGALPGEDWNAFIDRHAEWDGPPQPARESMIYTSGTTGRPKGVRRQPPTPAQAAATARNRAQIYGLVPGIRSLVPGPMYHSAPNGFGLRAVPLSEVLVLMPRFDPEELLALIERHRITTVFLVPTMMVRLLRLDDEVKRRYDLSSLRHVTHAAAPCPAEVKQAMLDWWGPVIHEFYGATDLGAPTACTPHQWLAKPGTVGTLTEGATVRILDDAGVECPPGTPGEIFARVDYMPDFTYNKRDGERRAVERDGLITVGDVGYFDADGYLFLCDRKRDMVISGGVNIYPAEIEAVMIGIPGVLDCAVFGIPDPEFGEALCAAIRAAPGATEAGIREALKVKLANFKVPRVIEFHDELPRDDSGKLLKRKLRDPHWQGAGRAI